VPIAVVHRIDSLNPEGINQMKNHLFKNLSLVTLLTLMSLFSIVSVNAQTQQEHVHNMSRSVMPFDMAKTLHIFKMTESGGIQKVFVKDTTDTDQIALIKQHLYMESEQFQHGNYSDPVSLHGADMPGLKELQIGASSIKVLYIPLPNGAEITFEATDLHLITALHRWFGAQLSEHGADAKAE
jgi:hypothetical protein